MAFLSVVGLTACSGDEPKDSVKEIRMQVSAETGVMYAWGDDKKENPIGWFRPYVFAYPYSPRQTCDRTGNSGR